MPASAILAQVVSTAGRAYLDAFNFGYVLVAAAGKLQSGVAVTEEIGSLTAMAPYAGHEFAAPSQANGLAFLSGMATASDGSLRGILPAGTVFKTPLGGLEALINSVEKTVPNLAPVLAELNADANSFIGAFSQARAGGAFSDQNAFQSVMDNLLKQPGL